MKNTTRNRRSLLFFAGASSQYSNQITSSDLLKLTLVGATPFVPAIIGYFAFGITISTYYTKSPFLIWCVAAPFGALFIFFIEILLNATLSPGASSKKKWITALPRLAFSVILSLTLAIPLKLALFSGPVKRQLKRQLENELYRIENTSSLAFKSDSVAFHQALASIRAQKEECRDLKDSFIEEIDGEAPSNRLGIGEISIAKGRLLEQCEQQLATSTLSLTATEQRYRAARSTQDAHNAFAKQEYKDAFQGDLMSKLAAWHVAAQENSALKRAGILIFVLFMTLDLIPTFIKVGTDVPSYTIAERLDQKKRHVKLEALTNAYTQITHEQSKALIDAAVKKREVNTYRNILWATLRKLDIAYQVKQRLETQSVIQTTDPLDLNAIEQTIVDIAEFQEASRSLYENPSDKVNDDPAGTSLTSFTIHTTDDITPSSDKPFVLKRIV